MTTTELSDMKKSLDVLRCSIQAASDTPIDGQSAYSYASALRAIVDTHQILSTMQIVSDEPINVQFAGTEEKIVIQPK